MPRLLQFVLALIVGLGLLAWGVTEFVQTTAQNWFARDVSLRARLVVNGARASLAAHWIKNTGANCENSWLKSLATSV